VSDTAELGVQRAAALIGSALAAGEHARIAMRGTSMLPLLHEPMVLEIRRAERRPRIGEIVVFRGGDRLVAHRVVGEESGVLRCAGDACPDRTELVPVDDVIGVVAGVWSGGAAERRVDRALFRLRGAFLARTRVARAFAVRTFPWARPRTFAALYEVMSAIVRGDSAAFGELIECCDPAGLSAIAHRHRCAAMLHESLGASSSPNARALGLLLRRARWSTSMRTAKLREQLISVVQLLNAREIEPILLKGAARLWKGEAQAELHDSVDLDLLVAEPELDAARSALLDAGYREHVTDAKRVYYDRIHHHAPPLYPSKGGVTVELHRALAPRGALSIDTSHDALRRYAVRSERSGARGATLDRVGAALHSAVHGYVRPELRDVVLLARMMREMSAAERRDLAAWLEAERKEPVRLRAVVLFAARLAGISWPASVQVERFVRWMLDREDLPRPLRARPECYDAWLGAPRKRFRALLEAASPRSLDTSNHPRLRPIARALSGLVIACYVPLMRRR
jgi:hypothetical protein